MPRLFCCALLLVCLVVPAVTQAANQPKVYWKHLYTSYDFNNNTITFNGQVINNLTDKEVVSVDKRTLKFTYRLDPHSQLISKTLEYTDSKALKVPPRGVMRYYFRVKMPQGFDRESEVIKVTLEFKYTAKAPRR